MAKNNTTTTVDWEKDPDYKGKEHHVQVYRSMRMSPAYRKLTLQAREILLTLRDEFAGQSKSVTIPYNQISYYSGIRKGSIRKYLEELEAYGFIIIDVSEKRSKVGKPANLYVFSKRWQSITQEDADRIQQERDAIKKAINQQIDSTIKRLEELKRD